MNTPIDNGGPAFPGKLQTSLTEHPDSSPGMTKRELFAGMAMQGLVSNSELMRALAKPRAEMLKTMTPLQVDQIEHRGLSRASVSIANAMIESLKKP